MSTQSIQSVESTPSTLRSWLAVVVLGIATFTIVVTEFAPVGLLTLISDDLHQSPSTVGLLVTVYAAIGAVSALGSAVMPSRFPRKPLLLVLMLILVASNAAAMFAHSFSSLMVARIIGSAGHGLFWAMVAALATQIAPPNRMGLATSIVFGGVSIANVIGIPLVNLIGQQHGWRFAFGALSALSLVTAVLMALVVPTIRAEGSVGFSALAGVLRNRRLRGVYTVAIFTVAAHFGAFTYIEPFLRQIPNLAAAAIAALLFGFGAAGLVGNLLTGVFIDRHLKLVNVVALVGMCAALFGLGWFGPAAPLALTVVLLAIWGMAIATLFVGVQTWVLREADSAAIPAAAVYTTIFNSSSGLGALLGAWVLARSGLPGILAGAGLLVALSILIVGWQSRLRSAR
ncbi:MFS transporter [Burkholderia sp. Bp9126]|nr:MFS transporter [Burkholderia sp. Bp9126]